MYPTTIRVTAFNSVFLKNYLCWVSVEVLTAFLVGINGVSVFNSVQSHMFRHPVLDMESQGCWMCRAYLHRVPSLPYHTIPYHTIPWVCYRRRNQWLRLALALFCLPLIWLARVVYLLVGVAIPYHTIPHHINASGAFSSKRMPFSSSLQLLPLANNPLFMILRRVVETCRCIRVSMVGCGRYLSRIADGRNVKRRRCVYSRCELAGALCLF